MALKQDLRKHFRIFNMGNLGNYKLDAFGLVFCVLNVDLDFMQGK